MIDRLGPELADARFRLEPLSKAHAPLLFAAIERDRAYLREWLSWVDVTTTQTAAEASIDRFIAREDAGTDRVFSLLRDGRMIGSIGLHGIDDEHRHAEIGYWLAAAEQGQGIMTAACRAATQFGFRELGLHRLAIRCAVDNARSRAIPPRVGYTHEATIAQFLFHRGRFHDVAVYARLDSDDHASKSSSGPALA